VCPGCFAGGTVEFTDQLVALSEVIRANPGFGPIVPQDLVLNPGFGAFGQDLHDLVG